MDHGLSRGRIDGRAPQEALAGVAAQPNEVP